MASSQPRAIAASLDPSPEPVSLAPPRHEICDGLRLLALRVAIDDADGAFDDFAASFLVATGGAEICIAELVTAAGGQSFVPLGVARAEKPTRSSDAACFDSIGRPCEPRLEFPLQLNGSMLGVIILLDVPRASLPVLQAISDTIVSTCSALLAAVATKREQALADQELRQNHASALEVLRAMPCSVSRIDDAGLVRSLPTAGMVSNAAAQLGSVIERKRVEESFRLLEAAVQQMKDSALIISATLDGV